MKQLFLVIFTLLTISACSPTATIKVEAPDKPIVINMNINISHEIRVKVDKDLENTINSKSGIF